MSLYYALIQKYNLLAEGKMAKNNSEEIPPNDVTDDVYVGSYHSFEKATNPSALLQAIGPGGSFDPEFELTISNKVEQLLGQSSDSETEE